MFCDEGSLYVTIFPMTHVLIGYARCSTDKQDLAVQRETLLNLGIAAERIYTDKGFTGTTRTRPGLDQALAAVRRGDTLVVALLHNSVYWRDEAAIEFSITRPRV